MFSNHPTMEQSKYCFFSSSIVIACQSVISPKSPKWTCRVRLSTYIQRNNIHGKKIQFARNLSHISRFAKQHEHQHNDIIKNNQHFLTRVLSFMWSACLQLVNTIDGSCRRCCCVLMGCNILLLCVVCLGFELCCDVVSIQSASGQIYFIRPQ